MKTKAKFERFSFQFSVFESFLPHFFDTFEFVAKFETQN